MEIVTSEKDGVTIFKIVGRLDAECAEVLKSEFRRQSQGGKYFVFDLQELEYLDSTGLGAIVFCLKNCNERNCQLKLANLTEKPRMIFEITRAYRIFDIFDDLDQAVAAFGTGNNG